MGKRWVHSNQTVFTLRYLVVWCTKFRRPLLDDEVSPFLQKIIEHKVKSLSVSIERLDINPADVQLQLKIPPTESPHHIVQQIKTETYRQLSGRFPSMNTRVPTIWTRHYYCQTLGDADPDKIKAFIESQEGV